MFLTPHSYTTEHKNISKSVKRECMACGCHSRLSLETLWDIYYKVHEF